MVRELTSVRFGEYGSTPHLVANNRRHIIVLQHDRKDPAVGAIFDGCAHWQLCEPNADPCP